MAKICRVAAVAEKSPQTADRLDQLKAGDDPPQGLAEEGSRIELRTGVTLVVQEGKLVELPSEDQELPADDSPKEAAISREGKGSKGIVPASAKSGNNASDVGQVSLKSRKRHRG